MSINNLFKELKRRKMISASVGYVAVAWILLQAGSIIFPTLEMPKFSMKILLISTIIAFPFWLAFSWIYEFSGNKLQRTKEAKKESIPLSEKRKNIIMLLFTIAGIGGLIWLGIFSFNVVTEARKERYARNQLLPF